jgi:Transcriptional regulator PadR-like family
VVTQLNQITQYFETTPLHFLTTEEAVAYIVSCLEVNDHYGFQLVKILEQTNTLRISMPILYKAINFLVDEGIMTSYKVRREGRGAPPIYFKLVKTQTTRPTIRRLNHYWNNKYPDISLTLNQ